MNRNVDIAIGIFGAVTVLVSILFIIFGLLLIINGFKNKQSNRAGDLILGLGLLILGIIMSPVAKILF